MPIHNYECGDCRIRGERLVKMREADTQTCVSCNQLMKKLVSLPAKTQSLWNGEWNKGLSGQGKYDAGLGMVIHSERQRDAELDKRGWIRESDLGQDWWDSRKSEIKAENAKLDADTERYKENLKKFEGDAEKAVTETWTAAECLAAPD